MLEVKGVTKRYGKMLANDDISFAVKGGEIAVLLGAKRRGKIHACEKHYRPAEIRRRVTVDGHDAHSG